jgi:hypothetical protein
VAYLAALASSHCLAGGLIGYGGNFGFVMIIPSLGPKSLARSANGAPA